MQIFINDEARTCESGLSAAALLVELDHDKPGVALAINQQIVPRAQWAQHILQEGDALLLFQVIAGG
ncbi:sulfur carrier protein ThiS [uncultured Pluralibacter sp.]|uniref:sulfur carrier protein ThiS n=1 Tax=uncultured Pluralibacter sp. TaxID=1490864 RepID=UPI00262B1D04|nr:sulfur carrier protein ThiS [uncultured Pluralibacter sp.]